MNIFERLFGKKTPPLTESQRAQLLGNTIRPPEPIVQKSPLDKASDTVLNATVYLNARRDTLIEEIAERQTELNGVNLAIKAFDAADNILHNTVPAEAPTNG